MKTPTAVSKGATRAEARIGKPGGCRGGGARGRGRDPGLRSRRRHGLEPPGSSVDLGGSDSRQHGPVRVRIPDKPNTATIVANWIPGEDPAAGPNYYTFCTSARYDIYVDRNGDGKPDITYYFRFKNLPSQFFLGNTQQRYTVTKVVDGKATLVKTGL